jgi:DNA-binding SARP family transcriptional activator/pimeloyl-ACP methyl ester carboxylesterase
MFGPLSVEVAGRRLGPRDLGGRKPKQVLEVLLVNRGQAVPKDRLVDVLWGERLPRDPMRTLEASVSVLRSRLHPDPAAARRILASERAAYRLPLDDAEVDLWRFDDLVEQAADGGGEAPSELRRAALRLVRGDVLADEPYAEWALPLRDLYAERHVQLLLDCAEDALAAGDSRSALEHADDALRAQPTRERAHRLVMAAHHLSGEQDRALRAYDRCRDALAEELGVSPLPETEAVYLAVLNQERAGEVVRLARTRPAAPRPTGVTSDRPVTRFARNGRATLAYQAIGDGPLDVIVAPGWFSHVEVGWEEPRFAAFMRRLAQGRRVLLFDRRGTGMSDPAPPELTFDERADDIVAVMDAAGSERAVIFGVSEGGPMGVSVAARTPERVRGLVLSSCFGRLMATPDYPWGWTSEFLELYQAGLEAAWTTGHGVEIALPSVTGDQALRDWVCRYLRLSVSPAVARATLDGAARTDVRHHLPAVRCPTLVLHRRDEAWLSPDNGRYVASRIPGARFVELPGVDYWPWLGDAASVLDPVEEMLDGLAHADAAPEGFPRVTPS